MQGVKIQSIDNVFETGIRRSDAWRSIHSWPQTRATTSFQDSNRLVGIAIVQHSLALVSDDE